MSHNEKRTIWWKEGLLTLISGTTYGMTSIVVGHPMDTVKTKMQAQTTFNVDAGLKTTCKRIWEKEGVRGFYRGALSPLIGSIIFRSLQFSVFESTFTYFKDNKTLTKDIPYTYGVQPRVILGGLFAAAVRTVIECPFEYAKVKKQTRQSWNIFSVYRGIGALYLRTTGLMTTFLVLVDSFRRHTNLFDSMGGQFVVAATSGSIAWLCIWPFENLKNVIQAETKNVGNTWMEKFKWMIKTNGIRGLYRGLLPGIMCVSSRNGASMIAMVYTQKLISKLGLREK